MHLTRKDVEALQAARQDYDEARTRRAWIVFARLQRWLGLYGCPFTGNFKPAADDVTSATDRPRSRHETDRPRTLRFAYY